MPRLVCLEENSMKCGSKIVVTISLLASLLIFVLFAERLRADETSSDFVSHVADVDGVKLHYTTGGHGAPVLLLH
jgi:hypothetical protein